MKLVASLIVHDELGRYLEPCIASLLEFCDLVCVYDDGSTDGTLPWLLSQPPSVRVTSDPVSRFYEHEGAARQRLLDWTLAQEPTHVLSIDADEFVTDGAALRAACEAGGVVWSLDMQEVWALDGDCLCIREDGGWRSHPVPILWAAPGREALPSPLWRIQDRQLACGREPLAVRRMGNSVKDSGVDVLHFGWACEAERQARYNRYVVADGGKFHASAHLQSIMWNDRRVDLRGREWPAGLVQQRESVTACVAAITQAHERRSE